MKPALPICLLVLCSALTLPAASTLAAPSAQPTTDKEKLSYAIGMDIGGTLKSRGVDVDQQMLVNAITDGLTGATPKMTSDQAHDVLLAFSKQMQAKAMEASAKASGPNKQAGEAFLASNKSKPGVQTLPDGLQYKVVSEGSGPLPSASDTVTVKYRGTLIDGKEFDSSEHQPGGTASFPVGGVIHGWTEALQKMKAGAKWQLFIPADLAYGDRGAGTDIAPGSTLIFDVELVSIAGK